MPHQMEAVILANEKVAPEHYKLTLAAGEISRRAQPGQFVHLRVGETLDPLLRRPLSIHDWDPGQGTVELLYRVAGKGTELLVTGRLGNKLDILGPLGQGFTWTPAVKKIVVVGGGIGVAPLLGAARVAAQKGLVVTALLGAREAAGLLALNAFQRVATQVEIVTDDGSAGKQGFVTHLLAQHLKAGGVDLIWACGPQVMLKEVAELAVSAGVDCQVSLEERMACGLGACQGCTLPVKGPGPTYKRVCKDGPVFSAQEVVWCV